MADLGVIHLVWVPLGLEPFDRFLASYRRFPGEQEHDLILAFNGHQAPGDLDAFEERAQNLPHQSLIFDSPQQDIATYFDAAQTLSQPYLCFVNSHSIILDAQWLRKLYAPAGEPGVGAVSATGSWQGRMWHPGKRENYRLWRHYFTAGLKMRLMNRRYVRFPNPHLRSNVFLMSRQRLLGLKRGPILNKDDAMHFEHGKQSLTRQLRQQKLSTLVVGRDGRAYDVDDWPQSETFCQKQQANLLVSDNRTRQYEEADPAEKQKLCRLAWGENASC